MTLPEQHPEPNCTAGPLADVPANRAFPPPIGGAFDVDTLRRVAALAQELQARHQDSLTIGQIEAIGAEVGLDSRFTRQALARLQEQREEAAEAEARRKELLSLLVSLAVPFLWGTLAFFTHRSEDIAWFLTLVAPAPLCLILGLLSGKRGVGLWSSVALVFACAPTVERLPPEELRHAHLGLYYLFCAGPVAGLLGWQGARFRDVFFPKQEKEQRVSRAALLDQLFALQRRLDSQRQRRSFVSVDVVGSAGMKAGAPDLAVEYSFNRFREWVAALVEEWGGVVHSAAGHGVMCMFSSEQSAVRAARRLQEDLARFNREENRLEAPFRVRCGISAGEVAWEEGMTVGDIQSAHIDRAAALQKKADAGDIVVSAEVVSTAITELGALAPLPSDSTALPAFSWRRGLQAPTADVPHRRVAHPETA